MKKLIVTMFAVFALCSMAMQAKDVKGVVIYHSDGQPVVGASVLVKGTTIETLTDVDGRFILKDLPEDAKSLRITFIGMQTRTVRIKDQSELTVELRREERIVTPFVKAGVGISAPQNSESNASAAQVGFMAGAGVSFALSHTISLTPALMFTQKPGKWEIEEWGSEQITTEANPLYLVVPLTVDVKLWLKNGNKIIINAGPYVGFGISGKYKRNGEETGDLFSKSGDEEARYKKVDAGLQYGIGYLLRHFYIGLDGQLGMTKIGDNDTAVLEDSQNVFISFSLGYYF